MSPAPPPSASAVAQAPAAGTKRRKAGKGAPAAATSVQELIAQATDRQTAREDIAERLAKFRSAMPLTPSHVDEIEALEARTEVTAAGESTVLRDSLVDPLAGITFAAVEWTRAGRRPRRVAFVGPTGAGKTTTLAKVAARAQLEQGRRVGIITIDTYRIGAVPQLQAYAEILGAPLAVAETPEALADALARMNDVDIVFIDTIGRSPLGGGAEGLAPFLSVAAADEVHLVLSAITRPGDSMRAARAFARLVPNRLSITKIDETEDHSALLMAARGTGLPLQWLGTGQEVPDDLDVATPDRLLGLVATEYVA
ncbi:MAG: hypothetical protein HY216_11845 [Candidatus Rokubacteria bacterium]|nr:hypothetical protein [Candidatus Rokubacteria bacterium]